jgi:alkaline phosphatase D
MMVIHWKKKRARLSASIPDRENVFMRKILVSLIIFATMGGIVRAQSNAAVTHGPIIGEVTDSSVLLWARGNTAGSLLFEVSENPEFGSDISSAAVEVGESSDFTGQVLVEGLLPAQLYFFRVSLDGGEAAVGQFRTAPASDDDAAFSFVMGGDIGGQGFCRTPEDGWPIFETVLAQQADFFLLIGDSIYADTGCPSDEGQNVPGAEEPARDLDGYRGRYRYHLEDAFYAALLAQTPTIVTWDDHEIVDNFGGPELVAVNAAWYEQGRQAFLEYWPLPESIHRQVTYGAHADFFVLDLRSFRDPLVNWDPSPVTGVHKTMLGAEQFAWLQGALEESDATWKFIVTSVPLAYPTGFPQPQVDGRDGWANGSDASGYETELMRLLFFIESHNIENVVFLAGDTHFPYAIAYDPDLDGAPNFYEFNATPLAAITLPPATVDQTFNPEVLYAEGEFMGGLYNFGQVSVAGNGDLTFRVIDAEGGERYSITIAPE